MALDGVPILEAKNISVEFGGLKAVDDVSFDIPEHGVVSLIGPNGAGKTTFFNVLTGLYKPTSGFVIYNNEDITGIVPHKIAAKGVARTFQNIRLFGLMTAEENVMVAMHSHLKQVLSERSWAHLDSAMKNAMLVRKLAHFWSLWELAKLLPSLLATFPMVISVV